ncbi:MAG TPA: hypothetical protein VFO38_06475 [Candidatus Saccharimonadales bacterium]|nr:hypothetical protein [Candidatus Saccharimonadales bacterium]
MENEERFRNHDNDVNVARMAMAAGIAQFFMAGMGLVLLILAGLAMWRAIGDGWVDYVLVLPPAVTGGIWLHTVWFYRYSKMSPALDIHIRMTFRGLWRGCGALVALGLLYLAVAAIF